MDTNSEINLLNRLESISSAAASCELNFQNLGESGSDIEKVSSFLGITTVQSLLFSCLAELSFQKTVTLDLLAKHLNCRVLKLITYMNELEALEKKGYIDRSYRKRNRRHSYNDIGFTVPHNVIESLRKGDASILLASSKFDLPAFLRQVSSLVDERQESGLPTVKVMSETEFLISSNKEVPYVSYVDSAVNLPESKCTIFAMSYARLKGQISVNIDYFANALFDDLGEQLEFAQNVASGNHELVRSNVVKLITSEFSGELNAALAEPALKELYRDYPALLIPENKNSGLISCKSLKQKKLYFNKETGEQLKSLEEVMNRKKFRFYRRELSRNGLSSGITAIFQGPPGTGKTEAVYQIALKTGRDIMMVDLSETKSKWFGESEKQVKKIFDDYNAALKGSDVEPILFINEADGLFTRRIDMNSGRNTSSDQAVNTMQNIILQALENFEGILLATTNLSSNLDKAFERRLTFKISFPRPDSLARQSIWRNKLPGLSVKEASILAERFDMSGGEIDVQVRHALLKKVLRKKFDLFEALVESCCKEHGLSGKRRVGF